MDDIVESAKDGFDEDIRFVLTVWVAGLVSFLVAFILWCTRSSGSTLQSRKFERYLRWVAMPLVALSLPLVYVAAHKKPPVPKSDASPLMRNWLYWYPRGCAGVVVHALLGVQSQSRHHRYLRGMYAVIVLAYVCIDSASLLLLRAEVRCMRQGTCDVQPGYTYNFVRYLVYRDTASLWLHLWSMILLGCLIAMTGPRTDLPFVYSQNSHARKCAMRDEMARCGFGTGNGRNGGIPPIYGLEIDKLQLNKSP